MIETWLRTDDLPAEERLPHWHRLAEIGWGATTVSVPEAAEFRSTSRVLNLGSLVMTTEDLQPVRLARTQAQIRHSDPERWHLILLAEGVCRFTQDGRADEFSAGDLLLHHTSAPFTGEVTASTSLFLQFPRKLGLAGLESLTSTRIPADRGVGALVAGCLRELGGLPAGRAAEADRLAGATLDLLNVLSARVRGTPSAPEAHPAALFAAVCAFIRTNLADPALDPATVAAAHHISVRYLHRLFQQEGQTVAGWIRDQRLERCRRDLGDPLLRERPAHAVARRWGFTDSAHFTRVFRAAFGLPPGAYRRLVQASSLSRTE
ncbi:helix-turn-helix domain-containing protein [Crossiella sp. NPDC003009]